MYKFAGVGLLFLVLFCSCQTTKSENIAYADLDPVPAGTFKVGVLRPFTVNIKQLEIPLTFNPRTGSVYFEFMYDLATYREFWNVENRRAFLSALDRYKADYDARNLNLKRNKSLRAYGTVKATIEWGLIKRMLNNRGYPNYDLGYTFRKDSPYFSVYQRATANIHASGDNVNNSIALTLYFTRAMADDLAALFSEDHLRSLLPSSYQSSQPSVDSIEDDGYYNEAPAETPDKDETPARDAIIPEAY
jgi:hypothetical protein